MKNTEIKKTDVDSYRQMWMAASPRSPKLKDFALAFLVGGAICTLGQALLNLYKTMGLSDDVSATLTSVTLIALSALATGIGVYDKLAKHAGAGTLVPITGFANAVVSPALEFKTEGWVTGTGSKMFIIAGPVIVYGIGASVLAGAITLVVEALK